MNPANVHVPFAYYKSNLQKAQLARSQLLAAVDAVVAANPEFMSMEIKSASDGNYSITMKVVHVEFGGISDSPNQDKIRILMDFGEHAREFVSSEMGLRFLRVLTEPDTIAQYVGGGTRGKRLLKVLEHVVFKILPMENELGRDRVEAGALCERKNGRGVDPNRNWEVDWGRKEKDYDPAEEYPGTAPFSEPEARTVLDIARNLKPHAWVNVHSGMEAMFTPWDHRAEVAAGVRDALRILEIIKADVFGNTCVVGSGGKSVGYLAHGTATDYMFEKLKVPMPYTWEVYGDMMASFSDCFRMFNPLTKNHLDQVINLWIKAAFRLIELIPTHPVLVKEGIAQRILDAINAMEASPQGKPEAADTQDMPPVVATHKTEVGKEAETEITQHSTDGVSSPATGGDEKPTVSVKIDKQQIAEALDSSGNGVLNVSATMLSIQHGPVLAQVILVMSCIAAVGYVTIKISTKYNVGSNLTSLFSTMTGRPRPRQVVSLLPLATPTAEARRK